MALATYDYTEHDQHVPEDRAIVATIGLACLALAQVAVIVYIASMRTDTTIPVGSADPNTPGFVAIDASGTPYATVFRPGQVAPNLNEPIVGANIDHLAVWFGPDAAVTDLAANAAETGLALRATFSTHADPVIPTPQIQPEIVADPEQIPVRTEMYVAADPVVRTVSLKTDGPVLRSASDNLAALIDYLGESGVAEMSERCGDLKDKSYRIDGGMMALCRQVTATL